MLNAKDLSKAIAVLKMVSDVSFYDIGPLHDAWQAPQQTLSSLRFPFNMRLSKSQCKSSKRACTLTPQRLILPDPSTDLII